MYLFSFLLHVSAPAKNTFATANHESVINYLLNDGSKVTKPAPGVEKLAEKFVTCYHRNVDKDNLTI